VKAVC